MISRPNPSKILLLFLFTSTFLLSNAQQVEWAKSYGSNGTDYCKATATDSDGNLYSCGYFWGDINDFDPGTGSYPLPYTGGQYGDIFIQKIDSDGVFQWAKQIGAGSEDIAVTLKVDRYNNVYVGGYYSEYDIFVETVAGSLLLPNRGNNDAFVFKLNAAGDVLWAKSFGGTGYDYVNDMAVDSAGNIFTMGVFNDSADFDPGPGTVALTPVGNLPTYIQKMDSAGNFLWVKQLPVSGRTIHVDDAGNGYLSGIFTGTVDFDWGSGTYSLAATPNPNSLPNSFILKLSPASDFVWVKKIEADNILPVISGANDAIYVTGTFTQTVDLNPDPNGTVNFTPTGPGPDYDLFIEKLDMDGNFVWAKQLGSSENESVRAINVDSYGNFYLTGSCYLLDFDPGSGISYAGFTNDWSAYFAKYNADGNLLWAENSRRLTAFSIGITSTDHVYTSGIFENTVTGYSGEGTINLSSVGVEDCFLIKFGQDVCSGVSLNVDSLSDITCSESGYASVSVAGVTLPYHLSWNTVPPTEQETVYFTQPGFYTVELTDTQGCIRSREVLVDAPDFSTGIESNANLVTTSFRTGFPVTLTLDAFNSGCTPSTGTLVLVSDSLLQFGNAIPAPASVSGDTLRWTFQNQTYDSAHISVEIHAVTSPNAAIGDSLHFHVLIDDDVLPDLIPTNNHKTYTFPVLNAYDPNDKSVYPAGQCEEHYTPKSQNLTYTVRFQNTGNAEAINIFILDSLSDDLDIYSVRIVGQSHRPMLTEILPGNVLKFGFNGIHLPDSGSNEPLSHGYVIFEVSPKSNVSSGTLIHNSVGIYFDFNPPVLTNSTYNTLVDVVPLCPSENAGISPDLPFFSYSLFPNPTHDRVILQIPDSGSTVQVEVWDMLGKKLMTVTGIGETISIPLGELPPNMYWIRFKVQEKIYIAKILKTEQ